MITQVYMPENCLLPKAVVCLILDIAGIAQSTRHSCYFVIYRPLTSRRKKTALYLKHEDNGTV